MATRTRTVLKTFFETGDKPTQSQFADLIDSMALVGESQQNNTNNHFPTDTITQEHIGRLFNLDSNGKAVLTQKTGGGIATPAIIKYSVDDSYALEVPTTPIFELTINTNFTDGETIVLPHPNPTVDLDVVFTAKNAPSAANEFLIGATIEDSRDALIATIQSQWHIVGKNEIATTAISTNKIQIEIISTSDILNDGIGNFYLPTDFNGIETDISTSANISYTQTQLGANGFLNECFYLNGSTYSYNQNSSCHLLKGSEEFIRMYPYHFVSHGLPFGEEKWALKFAQNGTDFLNNIIALFNGEVSGGGDLSEIHTSFSIDNIQTDGSSKYFMITQTNLAVDISAITAVNELTFPQTAILQQYAAASTPFVLDQVIGFVSAVVDGQVYASATYLNTGTLLDGSNTLPAPEMGEFERYKKLLLPSTDGKLENGINWGVELATPTPEVAAAMYYNGGYLGIIEKANGDILVRPQAINP